MSTSFPVHTDKIKSRLALLEKDRTAMLQLWKTVVGSPGSPIFAFDLLAAAAVKRNISAASAMRLMVESWNMACARSLLRTHIDTALRFSAAWLVDEPHELAKKVIGGERLDKIKDRNGAHLWDAYLVESLKDEYPWLPDVYKNLSGYIHFSNAHVMDSMETMKDDGNLSILVSDIDLKFPESSWIEIIDCFRSATEILTTYLNGYATTKRLSPEQLAAAKAAYIAPSNQ
jgi:hypothetical protein